MNAYTSSSSSSAMSAARAAAGSWSTFSVSSDPTACSSGGRSRFMPLREEIPAEQVRGVRALHVGTRVDDDIPGAVRRGIGHPLDGRLDVRLALAVGDDLVQGKLDVAGLLAAADVNVRDV